MYSIKYILKIPGNVRAGSSGDALTPGNPSARLPSITTKYPEFPLIHHSLHPCSLGFPAPNLLVGDGPLGGGIWNRRPAKPWIWHTYTSTHTRTNVQRASAREKGRRGTKSNHGRNEVDESMRGRLRSTAWRSPEPTTGSNASLHRAVPRAPLPPPSNADDAAAAARAGPPCQRCLGAHGLEGSPREAEARRGRRSEARVCARAGPPHRRWFPSGRGLWLCGHRPRRGEARRGGTAGAAEKSRLRRHTHECPVGSGCGGLTL
jgi:hypothetical protein